MQNSATRSTLKAPGTDDITSVTVPSGALDKGTCGAVAENPGMKLVHQEAVALSSHAKAAGRTTPRANRRRTVGSMAVNRHTMSSQYTPFEFRSSVCQGVRSHSCESIHEKWFDRFRTMG